MRLTGRMAETALAFARDGLAPATPRPAAVVILMRDGALGPEVYLMRRHSGMDFAAGMSVFPGGGVDEADASIVDSWSGPSPAWLASRLGCTEEMAVSYVAAAVRETFEESGVLLAGPDEQTLVPDTTGADWESDRVALEDRSLSFADFLHRRGLVVRADLLAAWAHWITPEFEPRRYDTRFFVAALPAGQVTRDVSGESDQVAWMRPAEAVRAVDDKQMAMLPPTYMSCVELAAYKKVTDVIAACRDRRIPSIEPRLRIDGEQAYLEVP